MGIGGGAETGGTDRRLHDIAADGVSAALTRQSASQRNERARHAPPFFFPRTISMSGCLVVGWRQGEVRWGGGVRLLRVHLEPAPCIFAAPGVDQRATISFPSAAVGRRTSPRRKLPRGHRVGCAAAGVTIRTEVGGLPTPLDGSTPVCIRQRTKARLVRGPSLMRWRFSDVPFSRAHLERRGSFPSLPMGLSPRWPRARHRPDTDNHRREGVSQKASTSDPSQNSPQADRDDPHENPVSFSFEFFSVACPGILRTKCTHIRQKGEAGCQAAREGWRRQGEGSRGGWRRAVQRRTDRQRRSLAVCSPDTTSG